MRVFKTLVELLRLEPPQSMIRSSLDIFARYFFMNPKPISNQGTAVILGLTIALSAFLYPVAVIPLRTKHIKEDGLEVAPGFSKKSAWKELENTRK